VAGADRPFLVPVLLRLRAFEQEHDRAVGSDRSVLDASRHAEEIASAELDRLAPIEIDPELALPAQEQLVLVVMVPRELAVSPLCSGLSTFTAGPSGGSWRV
jgi:hypothetical protein